MQQKSLTVSLLLCIFLGVFGFHRFYAGKVFTGLLYFFSFGFFGLGPLFDLFLIITGNFTDKSGQKMVW